MQTIGDVYTCFFKFDAAEPLLKQALDIRRQALGAKHQQVADSLHSLAVFHFLEGDFDGSEDLCRDALAMRRDLLGEQNIDTAMSEFALGWNVLVARGDRGEEAETLMRMALSTRLAQLGPMHRDVGLARLGLAFALAKDGKPLQAIQEMSLGLRTLESGGADKCAASAMSYYVRGIAAQRSKRPDEATQCFRKSLENIAGLFGPQHPITNYLRCELAEAQFSGRDDNVAEQLFREALEANRQVLGRRPFVVAALESLAWLLLDRHRHDEAAPLLDEVLGIQTDVLGGEKLRRRPALVCLSCRLVAAWGCAPSGAATAERDDDLPRRESRSLRSLGSRRRVSTRLVSAARGQCPAVSRFVSNDRGRVASHAPLDAPDMAVWTCVIVPEALKDPSAAVRIGEAAVSKDANHPLCNRALGAALYRCGKIDESIEYLSRSIELSESADHVACQIVLAMAYQKAGQTEKGRLLFETIRPTAMERIGQLSPNSTEHESSAVEKVEPLISARLAAATSRRRIARLDVGRRSKIFVSRSLIRPWSG